MLHLSSIVYGNKKYPFGKVPVSHSQIILCYYFMYMNYFQVVYGHCNKWLLLLFSF